MGSLKAFPDSCGFTSSYSEIQLSVYITLSFSTENLQLCLGEFLPRLLDPSTEIIVLKEPPTIRPNSPYDLCSRFAAVMESIQGVSTVTVN
jgi:hypothetical protein